MRGSTHASFGAAVVTASHGLVHNPDTLALLVIGAVLGSLVPDIDHRYSKISKLLGFSLERFLGHRKLTHSLLGLFLFSILSVFLAALSPPFALGGVLGYASHLLLDMTNVTGIPLLWPDHKRYKLKLGLRTGRIEDSIVCGLCILYIIATICK